MKKNGLIQTATDKIVTSLGAGTDASPSLPLVLNGTNELGMDAWGRQKVVQDYTLFSGLSTFNVPNRQWLELRENRAVPVGYIEQTTIPNDNSGVNIRSTNGMLVVQASATDDVYLHSKRHIRYQPNKGYLYSTAVILPNIIDTGTRAFGLLGLESGLYFEFIGDSINWIMNIVRRTTVDGVTTEYKTDITDSLPASFDPEMGHVYDIQAQWRGVGNIKFFIDLQLVHTENLLGTLTGMSVNNPALQIGWQCTGGSTIQIHAGCVDVSSEGGHAEHKLYTSATTGIELIDCRKVGNLSTAVLAVKLPKTISYNGNDVIYTRDMILSRLSAFCKDEMVMSIWTGRVINVSNLDAVSLWTTKDDSYWEYAVENPATDELDIAFQLDASNLENIYSTRQEKDFSTIVEFSNAIDTSIYLSSGDIIVFTIRPDIAGGDGGFTVEFSEEV